MNALAIAKARSVRRRREGGAIMFVVAMTTAVLASVGVFALAAAATEVRMSGNERQNTQTHYLAEYGVLAGARQMTTTVADLYVKMMVAGNSDSPCASLPNVPPTAGASTLMCRRLGSSELSTLGGGGWAVPPVVAYAGNAPYAAGVAPGSLGATPMNGDFFVELTELNKAPPPAGYKLDDHVCFKQMTVMASGITQPLYPTLANATTATFGGEGLETQRARLIVGPVTVACK
jgi:hypothetical protein